MVELTINQVWFGIGKIEEKLKELKEDPAQNEKEIQKGEKLLKKWKSLVYS